MTDCSRCGNCCENITISFDPMAEDLGDWGERGQVDLLFIREHWHRRDGFTTFTYSCDQFDPKSRLCTAHESRPPVCRDYPWYGRPPEERSSTVVAKEMSPQCSFNADVRTMLPIVEVRTR